MICANCNQKRSKGITYLTKFFCMKCLAKEKASRILKTVSSGFDYGWKRAT